MKRRPNTVGVLLRIVLVTLVILALAGYYWVALHVLETAR